MQDLDVLCSEGLFFFSTLLGVFKQGIRSSVSLVLMIIDFERVTKEFLSLADLFGAQIFCVYESLEIVIVGKYDHFMSKAL